MCIRDRKEEGGRHTPFFTKYRPQFYFRTTDVTGEVELPAGTEMVMPGDDAKFTVKLITPIAMAEKLNFAIREGGRTVGAGVVTKIIKYATNRSVAQLVERRSPKPEVGGSIPSAPAKKIYEKPFKIYSRTKTSSIQSYLANR